MIGAGKNGPPGKYERWLSSASSGSVGLAMITDRSWRFIRTENPSVGDSHSVHYQTFQVQVRAWKVGEVSVKMVGRLVSPGVQVLRCQRQMEQMQQYQQNQLELQQQGFQKLNEKIANMQIGIQTAQGKYTEEVQGLQRKQ
ncbi:hypothetical protein PIB30_055740 [Stylosanthes scabra]|uniref:Uncharacterized protein n=1 Tax=Stylosanthes scabra TaxID=79078 RepID=A0ABU6RJ86_9FABA|nr:hypothetical protein [Stylosanthes scabra]